MRWQEAEKIRSPESYFERDADGIRLKDHRMWLDDIVMLYKSGMTAQQIASEYPTLSLAEAEADIAYYRTHTDEVDRYMEQQRQAATERERDAETHPTAAPRRRLIAPNKNAAQGGEQAGWLRARGSSRRSA